MGKAVRIEEVKALSGSRLAVTWQSGDTETVDLAGTIADFAPLLPLADATVFAEAKVVAHGGGISWPVGLDLSADTLHEIAEEQRRAGATSNV